MFNIVRVCARKPHIPLPWATVALSPAATPFGLGGAGFIRLPLLAHTSTPHVKLPAPNVTHGLHFVFCLQISCFHTHTFRQRPAFFFASIIKAKDFVGVVQGHRLPQGHRR